MGADLYGIGAGAPPTFRKGCWGNCVGPMMVTVEPRETEGMRVNMLCGGAASISMVCSARGAGTSEPPSMLEAAKSTDLDGCTPTSIDSATAVGASSTIGIGIAS